MPERAHQTESGGNELLKTLMAFSRCYERATPRSFMNAILGVCRGCVTSLCDCDLAAIAMTRSSRLIRALTQVVLRSDDRVIETR